MGFLGFSLIQHYYALGLGGYQRNNNGVWYSRTWAGTQLRKPSPPSIGGSKQRSPDLQLLNLQRRTYIICHFYGLHLETPSWSPRVGPNIGTRAARASTAARGNLSSNRLVFSFFFFFREKYSPNNAFK